MYVERVDTYTCRCMSRCRSACWFICVSFRLTVFLRDGQLLLETDNFYWRRRYFIGAGVDSWRRRRGSSGMETGDGCSVLFTRLTTFKDGRLFKEAVVLF